MSPWKSPQDLLVAEVENDVRARMYANLSAVYDVAFDRVLQGGRRRAVETMGDTAGQRILEVGVGTGLNLSPYQPDTDGTGIDYSSEMLDRAEARVAREGLRSRFV